MDKNKTISALYEIYLITTSVNNDSTGSHSFLNTLTINYTPPFHIIMNSQLNVEMCHLLKNIFLV